MVEALQGLLRQFVPTVLEVHKAISWMIIQ